MINLPFAPSFERNNSQVPLKKQKVLIASRPSHSLVLTQAWDDPSAAFVFQQRGKVLVGFKIHSEFAAVFWGRSGRPSVVVVAATFLLLLIETAFCLAFIVLYSYPE